MVTFNKSYTNGEITIQWRPDICIHSGVCARGLPSVFDPRRKPWIEMDQASTEQVIRTVDACPSGALRWTRNAEEGEGI